MIFFAMCCMLRSSISTGKYMHLSEFLMNFGSHCLGKGDTIGGGEISVSACLRMLLRNSS
ncbi:MAG: hypothetical protein EBZ47_06260 [Chlamydiae bacterium]|nr:hypothetical protein [Chlamydiota bacterium]